MQIVIDKRDKILSLRLGPMPPSRALYSLHPLLENLLRIGDFPHRTGDCEAERDTQHRRQPEFQQGRKMHLPQGQGQEHDDRDVEYVHRKGVPGPETIEPRVAVKVTAEEGYRSQAYPHREDRIPEGVYGGR